LAVDSLFAQPQNLSELSIEELMDIQVTSVSKKLQPLSNSAAAVFVITNNDIKHSGATNIPDALRMAPGLTVARIDSNKWAINSRGPNNQFANKLLVLIDGRAVYTPSFSGIYWEEQDTLLEDIERIEVIRGPGATLWGANAVNGVINIITKHASDTLGGLVNLGGGNHEQVFGGARYGTSLTDFTFGRAYVKGFKRNDFKFAGDGDAGDNWDMLRGGFRIDSNLYANDSITVQGDAYNGNLHQSLILDTLAPPYSQTVEDKVQESGWNLLWRWQHTPSFESNFTLQAYYDENDRQEAFIDGKRRSFDLDFQHQFPASKNHNFIWGARYHYANDDFVNTFQVRFDPAHRADDLYSFFLQDEITLMPDRLLLTLGSKFENNNYTGTEVQPSARLLWTLNSNQKIWTAVSRAVRTPSRVETDGHVVGTVIPPLTPGVNPAAVPLVSTLNGSNDFDSEELIAYEAGYRFVWRNALSVDLSAFYNDYDNLRSTDPGSAAFLGTYVEQPLIFKNNFSARTFGAELALALQVSPRLKLDLAYSFQDSNMEEGDQVGEEPTHQVSLRAAANVRKDLDFDIWFRYVDDSQAAYLFAADSVFELRDYATVDMRLAWHATENLEVSLVGQNLIESSHMEFVTVKYSQPTEIGRSAYGKLTYKF
jgi:iron complex outermembrane receptor protein